MARRDELAAFLDGAAPQFLPLFRADWRLSGPSVTRRRTLRCPSRTIAAGLPLTRNMLTADFPSHARSFRGLSPHGFHRVVYYEWGDPANAASSSACTASGRNGRDFDVLGEALAPTHRVLAVDMPGRGESDWLADPNDYVFPDVPHHARLR